MFLQGVDPNIVVALITGVGGYLTARYQSRQDIKKNLETLSLERAKFLSEDQDKFRQALMDEFTRNREQLARIQEQNDSLTLQNVDLRRKILDIQAHNETLIAELSEMRLKNNELIERVKQLEKDTET